MKPTILLLGIICALIIAGPALAKEANNKSDQKAERAQLRQEARDIHITIKKEDDDRIKETKKDIKDKLEPYGKNKDDRKDTNGDRGRKDDDHPVIVPPPMPSVPVGLWFQLLMRVQSK